MTEHKRIIEIKRKSIGESWFVKGYEDASNGRVKDFDEVPDEHRDEYLEGLKDADWGNV